MKETLLKMTFAIAGPAVLFASAIAFVNASIATYDSPAVQYIASNQDAREVAGQQRAE